METSAALGFGFRCGFLGLLHLEIIQERLTREYDLDLITTAPSVVYKIQLTHNGGEIELHNPADMPDPSKIETIERAVDPGRDLCARRISRLDPEAVPGSPRHPEEPDLCRWPRAGDLRAAAQRSGVRLSTTG
jgi:hypothetical protein